MKIESSPEIQEIHDNNPEDYVSLPKDSNQMKLDGALNSMFVAMLDAHNLKITNSNPDNHETVDLWKDLNKDGKGSASAISSGETVFLSKPNFGDPLNMITEKPVHRRVSKQIKSVNKKTKRI